MSAEVKIVTDSTAYLTEEQLKLHDIRIVPLKVAFGTEVFTEGVDITNRQFYDRLTRLKAFPTTSQPSTEDFLKVYQPLVEQGHPIFSVHISRKLSGTYNSALAARDALPGARIEVVDWLSNGLGLLTVAAARAAEEGKDLPEIAEAARRINTSINEFGMLDTLEYLWRGGRIGAARALLGTLLKVKPVLAIEDGEASVLARVRTKSRAIEYILSLMERRIGGSKAIHAVVAHTNQPDDAEALMEEVRSRFRPVESFIIEFGPVFGTHLGPGLLGVGFYEE